MDAPQTRPPRCHPRVRVVSKHYINPAQTEGEPEIEVYWSSLHEKFVARRLLGREWIAAADTREEALEAARDFASAGR